jgi:hypothetical protein
MTNLSTQIEHQAEEILSAGFLPPINFKPLEPFDKPIELPPFPVDSLPPTIAAYVREVSEFRQTPLEMAGSLVLPVLSACTQKRYNVRVRRKWNEPLCLYSLVSALPSERKSGVYDDILSPIYWFQSEYNKEHAVKFAQNAAEFEMLENKITAIKKKGELDGLEELLQEKSDFKRGIPLRLTIEDSTPEKLIDLTATANNSMLLASPDSDLIDYVTSGRYENSAGISVYLKGFTGERVELDRVTRGSQVVEKLLLSIALTVQPYVISNLFSDTRAKGRGLTARFFYSMCKSRIGERLSNPPEINPHTEQSYRELIDKLLNHTIHSEEQQELVLSPEADDIRTWYQDYTESRLIGDMSDFSEWGGKLVGKMSRIAGIFHIIYCIEREINPAEMQIQPQSVDNAIKIADCLVEHARFAFSQGGEDDVIVSNAKYLWKRLKSEKEKTGESIIKKARCLHLVQPKLTSKSITEPLNELIERGFIHVQRIGKAETIYINPLAE